MTSQELGLDTAFEAGIVEHCVGALKAGQEMNQALMIEAMHSVLRRRYALLENPHALRLISDAVYDQIRATTTMVPARTRRLTEAERDAWPADGRHLLEKHFPREGKP